MNRATKDSLKTKTGEVKSKISNITNLATKAAFNTKATETENKIPDTSGFITTPELNRLIEKKDLLQN